jgi:integral membrane protein
MISSRLGWLRIIGFLEGCSFLGLAITMPLKYIYEMPKPNLYVGMTHGWLFIAYVILVLLVANDQKWGKKNTFWALLASLLPFGTFVADRKIFYNYSL